MTEQSKSTERRLEIQQPKLIVISSKELKGMKKKLCPPQYGLSETAMQQGLKNLEAVRYNLALLDVMQVGRTVTKEMIKDYCKAAMITMNEQKKIDKNFDGLGFLAQSLISMLGEKEVRVK